jgi:hypothetical protein
MLITPEEPPEARRGCPSGRQSKKKIRLTSRSVAMFIIGMKIMHLLF